MELGRVLLRLAIADDVYLDINIANSLLFNRVEAVEYCLIVPLGSLVRTINLLRSSIVIRSFKN